MKSLILETSFSLGFDILHPLHHDAIYLSNYEVEENNFSDFFEDHEAWDGVKVNIGVFYISDEHQIIEGVKKLNYVTKPQFDFLRNIKGELLSKNEKGENFNIYVGFVKTDKGLVNTIESENGHINIRYVSIKDLDLNYVSNPKFKFNLENSGFTYDIELIHQDLYEDDFSIPIKNELEEIFKKDIEAYYAPNTESIITKLIEKFEENNSESSLVKKIVRKSSRRKLLL